MRNIAIALLSVSTLVACNSKTSKTFEIDGVLKNSTAKKIYLIVGKMFESSIFSLISFKSKPKFIFYNSLTTKYISGKIKLFFLLRQRNAPK